MSQLGIIIGMMIVTYVPRALPFVLVGRKPLPPTLRRFLEFLPVCALGALLIPGAWTAIDGRPVPALAGTAAAALAAFFKGGLILSVIVGVGVAYLVLFLTAGWPG